MKKYLIALFALVFLLLAGAYISLFAKQANYQRAIGVTGNTVLFLKNFDNANIKIVTADTDEITVNLVGKEKDLAKISFEQDGIFARFGLSAEFSDLSGTIVVPRGTLLDVTLSDKTTLEINDVGGTRTVSDTSSFLVDTTTLDSFGVGSSGSVFLDAWGDLVVWDDENWGPLDGNGGAEGESDPNEPIYCGIGAQSIRDYCCETENTDTAVPFCNGIGRWLFDNSARDCDYVCELAEAEEEEEEEVDCGVGGQAERDACCEEQQAGEYQGCIGSWFFNNSSETCDINCYVDDSEEEEEEGDQGGGNEDPYEDPYEDPVSNYCTNIVDADDKDLCCNDALKNNLSSGPRFGFPDCIGKWYFDQKLGCAFECAEQAEMVEILQEIRSNLPGQ